MPTIGGSAVLSILDAPRLLVPSVREPQPLFGYAEPRDDLFAKGRAADDEEDEDWDEGDDEETDDEEDEDADRGRGKSSADDEEDEGDDDELDDEEDAEDDEDSEDAGDEEDSEDEEDEEGDEEEDDSPRKKKFKKSGDKKEKKKGKRKTFYQEEIDVSNLRRMKTSAGEWALKLGSQIGKYQVVDRPGIGGALTAQNPSLNAALGGSGAAAKAGGISYSAWPSVSTGFSGVWYFLSNGAHSLGLDVDYTYTMYRITVTLLAIDAQTKSAQTHNGAINLQYRAYPFRKEKSLVLMPRLGVRYFFFNGNDLYLNNDAANPPLLFFVDSQYYGLNVAPLNFIYYFPAGDEDFDIGFKFTGDVLLKPVHKESNLLLMSSQSPTWISGNPSGKQVNIANYFLQGGLTLLFNKKWGLEFMGGVDMLGYAYNPVPDPATGQLAANKGARGNIQSPVNNAQIKDSYYTFLAKVFFRF